MNWKKEGYKVGNTAYLQISSYFLRNEERFTDCKITYAGTKNLTVITSGGTTLKFNSKNHSTDKYGDVFTIYKSKEDYDRIQLDIETRHNLKNEIIRLLDEVEHKKVYEEIILMLKKEK